MLPFNLLQNAHTPQVGFWFGGREDLGDATGAQQGMSLSQAEQSQNLFGCGALARALLRVERQFLESLTLHRLAQLTLDEGLDQKRQET